MVLTFYELNCSLEFIRHSFRIYMFSSIVDLTTNNKLWKTILNFMYGRIASINLFQVNFDKSWNYL